MLRHLTILISLLISTCPLYTMEITTKDFQLKPTMFDLVKGQFVPIKDTRHQIYDFAREDDSKRSFTDELLWADHMRKNGPLVEDTIENILKIRYQQIISHESNELCFGRKNHQGIEYPSVGGIFWANKKQQQALYYLLDHQKAINNSYVLDNQNKIFLQDIDNTLQKLPKEITNYLRRPKWASHRLTDYYLKTHNPQLSPLNACVGFDNSTRTTNINRLSLATELITGGSLITLGFYIIDKKDNLLLPMVSIMSAFAGFGLIAESIGKYNNLPSTSRERVLIPTIASSGVLTAGKCMLNNTNKEILLLALSSGLGAYLGIHAAGYQSEHIKQSLQYPTLDEQMKAYGFERRPLGQ
jgi:hypothetical protein